MQRRVRVRMPSDDLLVELDAQARLARRYDIAVLPLDRLAQNLGVEALPALDPFEEQKIRAAGCELDVRGTDDRPTIQVRRDLHVLRLGHRSDFLGLEQPA